MAGGGNRIPNRVIGEIDFDTKISFNNTDGNREIFTMKVVLTIFFVMGKLTQILTGFGVKFNKV